MSALRKATVGLAVGLALPVAAELRVTRAQRVLTDRWRDITVEPRGFTQLGISFRPRQAEAFGLAPRESLERLLGHPFDVIRLGAYWNHMEPAPDMFDSGELDWQIDAAEKAGKQIIVCLGPVKTFGYPEYFVPDHRLVAPLREGVLVEPADHPALLAAGVAFITRVVERYRDRRSIIAWQVEHEAVDPLGMEHSWRLSVPFVRAEVDAVRTADPGRPIMMNGFLPTSSPVRVQQWWRTRPQGDSLAVAQRLADIVGIDFYPRHALLSAAGLTLYLDGSKRPWRCFDEMFDRYFAEIRRYAARRLGPDAAADVAAQTFLEAFRQRQRYDPDRAGVRTWLYGIAAKVVGRHQRAETRAATTAQAAV